MHVFTVNYEYVFLVLTIRYITVLVEMTRFESTRQGKLIASQMLDVTIRVKEVRPFSVRQMVMPTFDLAAQIGYTIFTMCSYLEYIQFLYIMQVLCKLLLYITGVPYTWVNKRNSLLSACFFLGFAPG